MVIGAKAEGLPLELPARKVENPLGMVHDALESSKHSKRDYILSLPKSYHQNWT